MTRPSEVPNHFGPIASLVAIGEVEMVYEPIFVGVCRLSRSAGAAQVFCIVPVASCQGGVYAVAAGGFHAR